MRCWIIFGVFGLFIGDCSALSFEQKTRVDDDEEMKNLEYFVRERCGVDFDDQEEELQKVSPAEVTSSVASFASFVNGASSSLDAHRPEISSVVSELQSGNIADILAHRTLFGSFLDTLRNVAGNGTCRFIQLFLVAKRLELAGPTDDFPDTGCVSTFQLIKNIKRQYGSKCNIAAAVSTDATLMRNVSIAITSDMSCVLQEISEYKNNLVQVQGDLGNMASGMTVRKVLVEVAGLDAWGSLLIRRVTKFVRAVKRIDKLIYDAPQECMTAPAETGVDLQGTLLKLKDLIAALENH